MAGRSAEGAAGFVGGLLLALAERRGWVGREWRQILPLAAAVLVLVTACAVTQDGNEVTLMIDGLKIENQTALPVSQVKLLVPATGAFVSCGNISARSMCSTRFPEANYSGNPVEISWSQGGQDYSTGRAELSIPVDIDEGVAAQVQVVIAGPGSAGAIIVQRQAR